MSLMNCSFRLLSLSLYLHSVAFIFSVFPTTTQLSLNFVYPSSQCLGDSIVSFCFGLNFSFGVLNSPVTVWCDCCLIHINVCIYFSPFCLANFYIWHFLSITYFMMFMEENICYLHFKMSHFYVLGFGSQNENCMPEGGPPVLCLMVSRGSTSELQSAPYMGVFARLLYGQFSGNSSRGALQSSIYGCFIKLL